MKYQCPICKKSASSESDENFPFCSDRCRLLDLGAWSSEKHVVSEPIFDEEELDRAAQAARRKADETIH